MEETSNKLRFGVMIDSNTLEIWQIETIKRLMDHGIELALIIRNAESLPQKRALETVATLPHAAAVFPCLEPLSLQARL